ncbi:MAG TPA: cytochrome P450 [Gammaproteobacteria bacterium]|nr:cytochrome P450 [Gammaproteobacteria bacterium]
MISRAFSAVKKRIKAAISAVVYFVIADLTIFFEKNPVEKFNLKADDDPLGVGIVRLGRGYYGKNIAIIRSKLDSKQVEAQLKCVMDIREEKARSPYAIFQWITDSPFFLAMANNEAMPLRRRSMHQLNPGELIQKAEMHHAKFLHRLLQKIDQNNIDDAVFSYIQNILLSQLIGTKEVPLDVTKMMMKVELDVNMLLASIVPRFFSLRPDTRKGKQKFQQVCSMISKIMDDQHSLTDPENRLKLAFLFASNNLSKILSISLQYIFKRRLLYSRLLSEIHSGSESMPFLHAFYLEALRWTAAMNIILRYTAKGISTTDLTVPPNTLIAFDLKHMLRNSLYFENPSEFNPNRFIENEYPLHHGMLLPFGVGMRICPAVAISEKLFKWIIIHTLQSIDSPQYSFKHLFNDFYGEWNRIPSNDPSYETYVSNKNEQKGIDENSIQFILNANITDEIYNEPIINPDRLIEILYQAATYSFFTLIPYQILCVDVTHNLWVMSEAKYAYGKATSALERASFIQTMSHHWNIFMDKQVVISCVFKQDVALDINVQAKATADTLNAISDDIFKNVGCLPFVNNQKECKLNGYFSYVKPRLAEHHRFFQLVKSHMKPYDQSNGAVHYPKLTVDKDFVLSTPTVSS